MSQGWPQAFPLGGSTEKLGDEKANSNLDNILVLTTMLVIAQFLIIFGID